jgi:hypothetical protein
VNARGCCQTAAVGGGVTLRTRAGVSGPRRGTRTARVFEIARCIVPSAILALLPKCPACLAAYLAMGSGMGISVVAAGYVRAGLIGLSAVSLGFFVVRLGWQIGQNLAAR